MLFKKKTNCQAYLHRSSQKIGKPGVFKTYYSICSSPTSKIICTKDRDFKANCDILPKNRGYKNAEIYDSISKAFDKN